MHKCIQRLSMDMFNKIGIAVLIVMGVLVLVSCERQAGPAERAGKAIDNATVSAGKQVEKAGESIQGAGKGEKP